MYRPLGSALKRHLSSYQMRIVVQEELSKIVVWELTEEVRLFQGDGPDERKVICKEHIGQKAFQ